MTDIVEEEEKQEVIVEEVSEQDRSALAKGWKPKELFEGDPKDWRDSKTFLEKGELLDAIHSLKKQSKEHKDTIEKLLEQQSKIAESSYKKALEDIQTKHREAVQIGDTEAAGKAALEMIELSKQEVKPSGASNSDIADFIDRNKSWFNYNSPENASMTVYADKLEQQIRGNNPHFSQVQVLDLVEKDIKNKFASHFRVDSKDVAAVSAPKSAPVQPKVSSIADLPRFQQLMIQKFRREIKGFDEVAYIKQIREISTRNK